MCYELREVFASPNLNRCGLMSYLPSVYHCYYNATNISVGLNGREPPSFFLNKPGGIPREFELSHLRPVSTTEQSSASVRPEAGLVLCKPMDRDTKYNL